LDLKASQIPFCIGLTGAMMCQGTPISSLQASIAFEVNSVPWSRVIRPGDQRCQFPRDTMARDQGVGQSREAFLHEIFDQVEDPKPPTLGELVVHYVNRPERSNGSRRAFARDTVLEAGQWGGTSFCS